MAAPHPGRCRRTRFLYQSLSCRLAHLERGGLPSLFFHPQLELHSSSQLLLQSAKQILHSRQEGESAEVPEASCALSIAMLAGSDDSHERNVRLACRKRVINIVAQIERCRRIALSENFLQSFRMGLPFCIVHRDDG